MSSWFFVHGSLFVMANNFKNLEVWRKSISLVKDVYILVKKLPQEELYSLTKQIKNCAVSVPSNIAEGSARRAPKDFIRFLNISEGSLAELETQLILSCELGFIDDSDIKNTEDKILTIGKMISGLRKSIQDKEKL